MQLLNKVLVGLGLSAAVFTANAAPIKELNNQNAAQCRKQMQAASTSNIVVAAYYPECHWWQSFKPNFNNVASSLNYPATYYRFDFLGAAPGVASSCLNAQPRFSPTIYVYSKAKKGYSLIRSVSGYKSVRELASFIQSSTTSRR